MVYLYISIDFPPWKSPIFCRHVVPRPLREGHVVLLQHLIRHGEIRAAAGDAASFERSLDQDGNGTWWTVVVKWMENGWKMDDL